MFLYQLHASKKNLCSRVWCKIYERFALTSDITSALEVPRDEEEEKDRSLLLALAAADSGNPAGDGALPLERYLARCDELNMTEMWGLLAACQESPSMCRAVSSRCQWLC